jgi:tetratricopeptide (TPR) repeat protein
MATKRGIPLLFLAAIILFNNCKNSAPNKEKQESEDIKQGSVKNLDVIGYTSEEIDWKSIEKELDQKYKQGTLNISRQVSLALLKSRLNKNQESIKIFSEVLKSEKTNCDYYIERATVYLKVGNLKKSIEDLNTALELCPDNFFIYRERGNAFMRSKQYKEAIEDLNKYIKYRGFYDTEALLMRANCHYSIKDFEKACKDVKGSGYSAQQMQRYPNLIKCLE